jgi:hypothetical protein
MMRMPNVVAAALFLMAVLSGFARMPLHAACCFALGSAFEWGGLRFWGLTRWAGAMLAIPGLAVADWADREERRCRTDVIEIEGGTK